MRRGGARRVRQQLMKERYGNFRQCEERFFQQAADIRRFRENLPALHNQPINLCSFLGLKYLVDRKRQVSVKLGHGAQVVMTNVPGRFARSWNLKSDHPLGISARFEIRKHNGQYVEFFVFPNSRPHRESHDTSWVMIPLRQMNRGIVVTPLPPSPSESRLKSKTKTQ